MPSSVVVAFPGIVDESPMVGIDPPAPAITCLHFRIEYSVRERTIRCRQCDELLDVFDWFVGYAERENRRLKFEADVRERKATAAKRHADRRRAKAAAAELAGPPVLPVEEARKRIAAMRAQLG